MKRWGHFFESVTRSKTTFLDPLTWKEPLIVFVCPWSDFFHPAADGWRDDAWDVIAATPEHFYLILTKRAQRIGKALPLGWPWDNVGLGVSVESGNHIWRLSYLEQAGAVLSFVSIEPILGPVDIYLSLPWLDWVILGGESGPDFRLYEDDWARPVRDACVATGTPFWFKQVAGLRPGMRPWLDGTLWRQRPLLLDTWGKTRPEFAVVAEGGKSHGLPHHQTAGDRVRGVGAQADGPGTEE